MEHTSPRFAETRLSDGNVVRLGELPAELRIDESSFEAIWRLRPVEEQRIMIHGRDVAIPRRQLAYGHDYRFSGQRAEARPIHELLAPYHEWARRSIDDRLNGLLVNWYDGRLGEYIGPHHDSVQDLVKGSPIATISLGEERVFRLTREERRDGRTSVGETIDLRATPHSAIVIPWSTNLAWKHSVPRRARWRGRRISITLRAFAQA